MGAYVLVALMLERLSSDYACESTSALCWSCLAQSAGNSKRLWWCEGDDYQCFGSDHSLPDNNKLNDITLTPGESGTYCTLDVRIHEPKALRTRPLLARPPQPRPLLLPQYRPRSLPPL